MLIVCVLLESLQGLNFVNLFRRNGSLEFDGYQQDVGRGRGNDRIQRRGGRSMGFIERGRVRNGGYGRGGYIPRRGSGSRDGPENTESVFKRYKAKSFY